MFGFSGSTSDSSSESESQFDQNVASGQSPYLSNMYGSAEGLYNNSMAPMAQMAPGVANWMQQTANATAPFWGNQMQGGAYQNMGLQQGLMDSWNQSANNPSAMQEINSMIMGGSGNNYADAMKQEYIKDANLAQDNMLNNTDLRASQHGQGGSSRHGIVQGMGMRDINKNLQSALTNTGYNTFDADLDRKLDIAQQADSNTLARQQQMGDMIGQQQNVMTGGLNYASNMQNLGMGQYAPYMQNWQMMNNYANALGDPTVLGSGTSSSSSDSDSGSVGFGW